MWASKATPSASPNPPPPRADADGPSPKAPDGDCPWSRPAIDPRPPAAHQCFLACLTIPYARMSCVTSSLGSRRSSVAISRGSHSADTSPNSGARGEIKRSVYQAGPAARLPLRARQARVGAGEVGHVGIHRLWPRPVVRAARPLLRSLLHLATHVLVQHVR